MATIVVTTPFTVQLDDPPAEGEPTKYVFPAPGTYNDVPDAVAAHPYTLPHLEGYEPPPPGEGIGGDTIVMEPEPEAPPPPDPPV